MHGPKVYSQSELGFPTGNAALAFALYIAGQAWADERFAKAEKREIIPLQNIYDADYLLHLGYGRGDGGIEELAVQAHAQGYKGIVQYSFEINHSLGPNTQAFNEYQKTLGASGASAWEIVTEIQKRHATGQLSLSMALCAATGVVVKRWREEMKQWSENQSYRNQRNENAAKEFDAQKIAEKMFLTGDFYKVAAVLMDARPVFIDLWKRYPPTIRLARGKSTGIRDGEAVNGDGKVVPAKIAGYGGFVAYTPNVDNNTRKDLGVKGK